MRVRTAWLAIAFAFALSACGGTATVSASSVTPNKTAAATQTAAAAPATGLAWSVSDKSKATVNIREQLAALNFPSDAVLVATGAKGTFQLNADGTFSSDSTLSFDVTSLTSDSSLRDNFVKQSVLATRQFPAATFVPVKATGLTLPLPATGAFTAVVAGKLTIHGATKDVTFDLKGMRTGGDLTATATLNPTFKYGDFGMPLPAAPGRVLSVVDEIKLVIDLVATGPKS